MTDQLRIEIKDFRAIKDANIKMNGITVVTGVNGCGKSTLAKLVYNTTNSLVNYKKVTIENFRSYFKGITRLAEFIENEVPDIVDFELWYDLNELTNDEFTDTYIVKEARSVKSFFIDAFKKIVESEMSEQKKNRIYHIIIDTLQEYGNANDINQKEEIEIDIISKNLFELIDKVFDELLEVRKRIHTNLVYNKLNSIINDRTILYNFRLFEYEVPIISEELKLSPDLYLITDSIYIESPINVGENFHSGNKYWTDLDNLLSQFPESKNTNIIQNFVEKISNEITDGEVEFEMSFGNMNSNFKFKRSDGLSFELTEVATGIKSFSILQLLLKNGLLTNKTLLIIDEPEAHLHPQWIVEYARVLVLLNKELGVKFLIASHSPDMVSAIRYISEKEETLDSLEYYLAEESAESRFQYNYKALGKDIDLIFKSFNIALDRINQYGVSNSDDLF